MNLRFYFRCAVVMLICVLIGFSPTFYLHQVFHQPDLPTWLVAHGISQTAWFVLLPVQAWLMVSKRFAQRRAMHRWLGWAAGVLALAITVTLPIVISAGFERDLATGLPRVFAAMISIIDYLRLPFFAVMVGMAFVSRHRTDVHTRALTLASIGNLQPATGRIAIGLVGNPLVGTISQVIFAIVLIRHDRKTLGHVHPVTKWGFTALFAIIIVPVVMAVTGWATWLADALHWPAAPAS